METRICKKCKREKLIGLLEDSPEIITNLLSYIQKERVKI